MKTIAAAFTAAWVFGLFTQWLRLSPIVGYLLGGIAIGKYTPGFVGDPAIASQLAEIGVSLLMFGVGLHFDWRKLLSVRRVALPGAVGQSLVATGLGLGVGLMFGLDVKGGLVLGMSMAVASTVVLIRVLTDNRKLDTSHGNVAVGWLIVEDILTVIVLVLIPAMGSKVIGVDHHAESGRALWLTLLIALAKLVVMVLVVVVGGSKIVPHVMVRVARLRSRELFTLTVLVMAVGVAVGAASVFGVSMALGAFLAGMVVGQSAVSQQAAADALPLRDAFAVLFFASVGMMFDPGFLIREPGFLLACLGVILIGKPLAALVIVAVCGYPVRTGIIVALGLAQIGEFSFILAALGTQHGLLNESANNAIVASAMVSITLNPILFRFMDQFENLLKAWPWLWRFLDRNAKNEGQPNAPAKEAMLGEVPLAVILGYGPVGRTVDEILREKGIKTVVVDLNMDTIESLTRRGQSAIYGDAYNIEVLAHALDRATHLVITLPHAANRNPLIASAIVKDLGTRVEQ
ncbi:MAG TPA: cation:proton antiporter, partial [Tepidisphaeraceae bacterium]|nr:cation:proton antiporter [Tepidisphaeraceae bacterium]